MNRPAVVPLSQVDDPRLADYVNLTDVELRRRMEPPNGLFIAESDKVIRRALAAGYPPRSALTEPRWVDQVLDALAGHDVPVYVAAPEVLAGVTGYRVHRGALAAMSRLPEPPVERVLRDARRLVVLEGIVDHTNVGAVFRSAAALGVDGVLIDPTCADPLYRRSIRVSMGSVFAVPWARVMDWPAGLDRLAEHGFVRLALSPREDAVDLSTLVSAAPTRVALCFGTEGAGLTDAVVNRCDAIVRIPMAGGVDSLNIAAASAVACYALRPPPEGTAGAGSQPL